MNKIVKLTTLFLICILCKGHLFAQNKEESPEKFMPSELNISSSAVFELMGVTPSQISRSSDIKDFKVDWSFKSWRLNPNIAVQGQPLWEMFYSRKSLEKYRNAGYFGRMLASLDVSAGTVQNEKGDRRIGFGGKINLYKAKDPLLQYDFFNAITERYNQDMQLAQQQIKAVKAQIDTTSDVAIYRNLSTQLLQLENSRNDIITRQREEITAESASFAELYWNTSYVDLGAGSIYTYKTDSAGSLKKLNLNRNTGYAAWLTAGLGIGRNWLISGMARRLVYDEQVTFKTQDTLTFEEFDRDTIFGNNLITFGVNIRYGSPYFNIFIEYFADLRETKNKFDVVGFNISKQLPNVPAGQVVIDKTVSWNLQPVHSLTLGGDWRMSRNVMLNFGLRMEFDAKWKKQTFIPISTLVCLMR